MTKRGTFVREKKYGDFSVRFTYANTKPREIGSGHEACIAIVRPEHYGVKTMVMIFEDAIHQYVNDGTRGGPSDYCIAQCANFAELLGLTVDKRTVFRLCEAILDSVADLYKMPPYMDEQKVIGEVEANFGGTKISTELYQ